MATIPGNDSAAAFNLLSVLPTIITLFPLEANNLAISKPMPEPPPVMSTVLFVIFILFIF
jgi:hypothetical protein